MMNSLTPLKRKTTQSLVASILIFSMLAGMLSACNMIIVTPIPTEVIDMELIPSQDLPAIQELTLVSPTEVATEMPVITLIPEPTATMIPTETATEMLIPTLDLESATAIEDMRKLKEMFETNKDIDNLVLAPEQVFSDFYNKVIPSESELRTSIANNERYNIGVPYSSVSDSSNVQAILMGGFTNNNGAYLLLGTESAATGDRSIIPVQCTFGSEGRWSTIGVKNDTSIYQRMEYDFSSLKFVSAEELLIIVKENLGKNIFINYWFNYDSGQPMGEDSKIAKEKYYLFERFESNKLYINDPLKIDKNNLVESPWTSYFAY